jgi:hypothetical protein
MINMKKILTQTVSCALIVSLAACKKDTTNGSTNNNSANATIVVHNATLNIPTTNLLIKMNGSLNISGANASSFGTPTINWGASAIFNAEGKSTPIEILNALDSSKGLSATYNFKKGGIYSLFLGGLLPTIDPVFIEETNFPFINLSKTPRSEDSIINIRFVNLTPNIQLDVKISGSSTNEITGLPYKGYTQFKAYSAKQGITSYSFQFVYNGVVLRTQALSIDETNRFKNVALVLRGQNGGPLPFRVGIVNYFQ